MRLIRECKTCEFNFDGVCAGEGNAYEYGARIIDDTKECDGWEAGFEYYSLITEEAPWYIKEKYKNYKIQYDEFIKEIEDDHNGLPIEVNLYDAIEKIYDLTLVELAEVLNVSLGVINYAKSHGTIPRRTAEFSTRLCMPTKFFNNFSSLDFNELKKCKEEFYSVGNPKDERNKNAQWKEESLIPKVACCLGSVDDIAQKFYTITHVEWKKGNSLDSYNELEKEFIDFIIFTQKRRNYKLTHFEYLIDGIGYPKLYLKYWKVGKK
ncbi:MAG: hypothetical protein F8N38_15480 [Hungatella sp.]|nr:hypothetical protein [Hungatella sp.]